MSRKSSKTSAMVSGGGNILTWQEDNVNDVASPGSYPKGADLASDGSVLSAAKSPTGVVGSVRGSDYTPYSISISLDGSASCSCPDRRGGWCKHAVAVMLQVIRGNPGAAIATSAVPSFNPYKKTPTRAAPRAKRAAATKKKKYDDDDFVVDDDEEEEEEEESDESSSEDEPRYRKSPATFNPKAVTHNYTPAIVAPTLFGAPQQQPTITRVGFGNTATTPVPILTETRLVVQAVPQLPFQPVHHVGHGVCNDCRRTAFGGVRCSGCSGFSLCIDCEQAGRAWHHVAMMGAGHTFA